MLVNEETGADHPSRVPNGLTASAPGAAVVLTGIHTGVVDVTVQLADAPPYHHSGGMGRGGGRGADQFHG